MDHLFIDETDNKIHFRYLGDWIINKSWLTNKLRTHEEILKTMGDDVLTGFEKLVNKEA